VGGQVILLALSGVVGLTLGDQALFISFADIGPRLAMLIMAGAPIFAVLFGWLALGETLSGVAWLGILLTVGGIVWVLLQKPDHGTTSRSPHRTRGIVLAFVAAACQAAGLLLSKQGIGHGWLPEDQHLDPQAATFIRMSFAGLGVVPIVLVQRHRRRKGMTGAASKPLTGSRTAGFLLTVCAATCGAYLGVWMSLVATDRTAVGIAQTLCSLTPVFILPFAASLHKEHIGARAILGALIAVGGCALLFMFPQ
jgi:drug/metabolite transporter (DMT)-like permease